LLLLLCVPGAPRAPIARRKLGESKTGPVPYFFRFGWARRNGRTKRGRLQDHQLDGPALESPFVAGIVHDHGSVFAPIVDRFVVHRFHVFLVPEHLVGPLVGFGTEVLSLDPEFGVDRALAGLSVVVQGGNNGLGRFQPFRPDIGSAKGLRGLAHKDEAFEVGMFQDESWQIAGNQQGFCSPMLGLHRRVDVPEAESPAFQSRELFVQGGIVPSKTQGAPGNVPESILKGSVGLCAVSTPQPNLCFGPLDSEGMVAGI